MKHHLNRKHLATAFTLLLGLLLLLHSCRKEHAVPAANVLASYKGSDKNVLKIIDELKKPENKDLLANLNQQGEVDWQNYQTMLTSDFMQGLTLRFYQGPDSNYFDAQLNLETKSMRLLSKTQKLVEREHAIEQLKAESKTKGKSTTTYTIATCKGIVNFEYVLYINRTTININDSFEDYYNSTYLYYSFLQIVRQRLGMNGFAFTPSMYFVSYSFDGNSNPLQGYYNEVTENIKRSFIDALGELKVIPAASNYFIYGYLARVYITLPTCTMPDVGGTGGGGGGGDGFNAEIKHKLDSFPCAKNLVAQMNNLNSDLSSLIENAFNKNDRINLTIEPDYSLRGTSKDGILGQSSKFTHNNQLYFNISVGINPDVLKNATKEYILVTIYHETIHAYLALKRLELGETEFNNQFIGIYVNGGRLIGVQDPQHWSMAYANFVNGLKNMILSYNPSFNPDRAHALALGGIISLTPAQTAINQQERNTTNFGYTGTKCP